jgi:hypothetical protein
MRGTRGGTPGASAALGAHVVGNGGGVSAGIGGDGPDVTNGPGASWMNKRAEEEYQRALEYVVDQDFSLSR